MPHKIAYLVTMSINSGICLNDRDCETTLELSQAFVLVWISCVVSMPDSMMQSS